jgi:hypothetical protein
MIRGGHIDVAILGVCLISNSLYNALNQALVLEGHGGFSSRRYSQFYDSREVIERLGSFLCSYFVT